ncbi:MAG: hypothetical protein D6788_04630 [Planctomycetota bacterium]|nr:MAG: hypothetical protein D6788_04630 [Planctomycetota bacterium]
MAGPVLKPEAPPSAEPSGQNGTSNETPKRADLTVADLVRQGMMKAAAERVLPASAARSPQDRIWLREVFSRIKAISRALEHDEKQAAKQTPAALFARALVERYETLMQTPRSAGPQPASPPWTAAAWKRWGRERELVRALDQLMGRMAFGKLPPQEIESELARIGEEIREILLPSQGLLKTRPGRP